jgi:hypothetical protein
LCIRVCVTDRNCRVKCCVRELQPLQKDINIAKFIVLQKGEHRRRRR